MQIVLYDWGPSPFCLKVRSVLDYKRIAYERVNVLGTPMVDVWWRGRIGKVPALEIDGRLVCDSTDICHALEERCPAPPIVPSEPRERGLCHALEDWADESLYFLGIYFQWWEPRGNAMVARAFPGAFGRAAQVFYERRIAKQLKGQGTARKPEAHVRRDLGRELDALAGLLEGRAYVLGDEPWLCDFAIAAQVRYLERTPVGGEEIGARRGVGEYLARMKQLRARA
jgi:glutathione S-transferase